MKHEVIASRCPRVGVGLILLTSLAACSGSSATNMAVAEPAPESTMTAGAETFELHTGAMTSPAELRARINHPLVRPPLARIEAEPTSSWVFAAHPGSLTRVETRPALAERSDEPYEYLGSVSSDPVGRTLITTLAEAGNARLRYVP